jgi:type II secretory pathway component PulK
MFKRITHHSFGETRAVKDKQNGAILILAVFVLTFLSILALSLSHYVRLRIAATRQFVNREKAYKIARAAVAAFQEQLEQDRKDNAFDHPGDEFWKKFSQEGKPVSTDFLNVAGDKIGTYQVAISDESGKLNINTVSAATLARFLALFLPQNDAQQAAAAIISRRQAKLFASIYELLDVGGVDRRAFLGEDTNSNKILDTWEDDGPASSPLDNQNGKLDLGLKDYLTVYTSGPININTVSPELLLALPGISETTVRRLTAARERSPITDLKQLKEILEITEDNLAEILAWATLKSDIFEIAVTAQTSDAFFTRQIMAIIDRSSVPSTVRFWQEE